MKVWEEARGKALGVTGSGMDAPRARFRTTQLWYHLLRHHGCTNPPPPNLDPSEATISDPISDML